MTARLAPPFSEPHWQQVEQFLRSLTPQQARWLGSYLADQPDAAPTSASGDRVLIAYGSETGNSEALAQQLATLAGDAGIAVDVEELGRLRLRQLVKRRHLIVICSTHGDGDPPEPAETFHDALMDDSAPELASLQYAVLALGDSSYDHFCLTGQQLDTRLASLGAQRLVPRQDCDVDFARPARAWFDQVLTVLPRQADVQPAASAATAPPRAAYSKTHPLTVEVIDNIRLSAEHRHAPIHHLELTLDEPLALEPGDAVGILADNPPSLVAALLNATGLSGDEPVTVDSQAMPLVQALRQHLDLVVPSARFLTFWASLTGAPELLAQDEAETKIKKAFLRQCQVRDLIGGYPATPAPQALVDNLRPLQPRLYDVANSLSALDDELHLTVKDFTYAFGDRQEAGIASRFLLNLQPGDPVRLYPHRNARFHLPESADVPLILIADGTGIAPYRAFLQAIENGEARHPCWLIFSERRFEEDFLYQVDLQQARAQGALQHVDTAFREAHPSRDLADAIGEQSERFHTWLEKGAHLYLCGDKARLGACDKALECLYERHAGAGSWKQLTREKRIHRNLY
ncbi:sulfite reductase flavoprotein subunit alpha [Halomonas elongata]|uniref:diflavin oxidoreductase n=1 Tax=Halomonas elongata TaxID=2746 RepID=UPI0038D4D786